MRKLAMSPQKLEAAANLLRAKIEDLDKVIKNLPNRRNTSTELYDLRKKRQKYVDSLERVLIKTWKIEFEAMCACEELKGQIPSYLGMPCADYRVPQELIKYIKLDYEDE